MAFEAILAPPDLRPQRWRRVTLGVSLVLHSAALVIGIIYSLWRVDEMPLPAIQVTLAEAPPPPPPPPPPAGGHKSSPSKPKVHPTKAEVVQPKEQPKEEPKPQEDEGPANGVVGGVVGGVAGGVVGGVVGGVLGSPAPPPPKDTGPKMVSAGVGHHQLAIDASSPPYCCPKIPRALDRSGMSFTAQVRVCVSPEGQVTDAQILRGAGPGIDQQIPAFVRRWRYRPLIVDGRATAFCYPFTYDATVR